MSKRRRVLTPDGRRNEPPVQRRVLTPENDGQRNERPVQLRYPPDITKAKLLNLSNTVNPREISYWEKIYMPTQVFADLYNQPIHELALAMDDSHIESLSPLKTGNWTKLPKTQINSSGLQNTVREAVQPLYEKYRQAQERKTGDPGCHWHVACVGTKMG